MLQFGFTMILLAIPFFLILFYYYRNRNSIHLTNWPIVGMLPGLLCIAPRLFENFSRLLNQYGGTFEFKGPWFSNFHFVITSDHMNANHILCKNFDNYGKGHAYKEIFFDALGDGIFNSDSDSWRIQRKVLLSLIKNDKFEQLVQKIMWQKLEKSLIPILEHFMELDAEVDLQDVFQRFNYDNMCMLMLGLDPNSLSIEFPEVPSKVAFIHGEEALLYRHVMPISFWKLQRWLQIGGEKKMGEAMKILDDFAYGCISSKQEKFMRRKSHAEQDEFDFLTRFMVEAEKEMGASGKSNKFLRDTAINMMGAGKDSISSGLSWFFWLVAMNPSVEAKILEEIDANSPTSNTKNMMIFSGDELNRFVYLHAVICETLRLYPPVPINHKAAIRPEILPSGRRVHRNTRILIDFYSMGRKKQIWGDDCLEFKPERWISEQGDIVHVPSYKFTAFNAGPRTCLGRNISFIQMKMVAIAILRSYKIQVVNGDLVSPSIAIILHMKNGLKVRIKKRCDN